MHYVYILKSRKTKELYLGCTIDLEKRIKEHNANRSFYTKNKGPWEVRYYEAFHSKEDAFNREKQLKKHARGIQELKKILTKSLN